jgi:hypothetical protein
MTYLSLNTKEILDEHATAPRDNTQVIWVTFDKVGFHRYPQAPDEVAYLRTEHRHVFKFRVSITVHHDDREIEFHMFKNWMLSLYDSSSAVSGLKVNHQSCEMLADDLLKSILQRYDCSQRTVAVEVSEDGECGAILTSSPHKKPVYVPPPTYGGSSGVQPSTDSMPALFKNDTVLVYGSVADTHKEPGQEGS